MNYYSHNVGDFATLTQGLDLEGVGIVIRMIDRMMSTEKPIKTQWVNLAFPKETQEKAKCILENLFEEVDDGWIHPELMSQIDQYQRNAQKNRENGKKGGRPRKTETQTKPSGFLEETQTKANETLTINQEPLTINQEEVIDTRPKATRPSTPKAKKPEGVTDQVWSEWQSLKKKLCKSCTQRMVDALVREASKAGMSAEEAMVYQLEKGWKGFEAEWVKNDQQRTSRPTDPQYGIGVCQPIPEEEVHWLTDEERAESRRQMEAEGYAPF